MKKILLTAGALAITAALAGCTSTPSPAHSPAATQKPVPAAAAETTNPAPAPTPSENLGPHFVSARSDGSKPFGAYFLFVPGATSTYDYSKDLMIEVDRVGTFTPSNVDASRASKYTQYRLKVINHTTSPIDLGGAFAVSGQDGSEQATRGFEDGWSGGSTGTLLPGRTINWSFGFSDTHNDEVVTVQPIIGGTALGSITFTK